MFQHCISTHFKWCLEIFFQRKTGGCELDGADIPELTARNITGRCNSDCKPAAGLQALTQRNCSGAIRAKNDHRTVKTLASKQAALGLRPRDGSPITSPPPWDTGSAARQRRRKPQSPWSCAICMSDLPVQFRARTAHASCQRANTQSEKKNYFSQGSTTPPDEFTEREQTPGSSSWSLNASWGAVAVSVANASTTRVPQHACKLLPSQSVQTASRSYHTFFLWSFQECKPQSWYKL